MGTIRYDAIKGQLLLIGDAYLRLTNHGMNAHSSSLSLEAERVRPVYRAPMVGM